MFLPYVKMTAQEDQIGNLQIWRGDNTPKPKEDSKIAYIQDSQEKLSLFDYCFDLESEDIEELEKGYTVVINLHIEMAQEIFC